MSRYANFNRLVAYRGVAGLLLLSALGACGSSVPVEHPVGAEESILRIAHGGGMVTPENEFLAMPDVVITGDGRVILGGLANANTLGVEQLRVRSITEDGIQHLLDLADRNGFLGHREVSGYDDDSGATFVNIWAKGEQFTNGAYGSYGEADGNRDRVSGFVGNVYDYLNSDSDELGPEGNFEPAFIDARAELIHPQNLASYDESEFLSWELGDDAPLADIGWCSRLDADVVGALFDDLRFPAPFTDDGSAFKVTARPALRTGVC